MTVSYQNEVGSSTSGGFTRLLLKWRGSLYKLIYRELAMFLVCFAAVAVLYRHLLSAEHKKVFEQLVLYCNHFVNLLPLSFVVGFYVSFVAQRWWNQYMAIPWPDKLLHAIALYVRGTDENSRMIRRSMVRYLNLTLILLMRSISSAVKRRFPTLDHLVEGGFMTSAELEEFSSVPRKEFNTYWIPCCWFISLVREARITSHLVDSNGVKLILETFNEFRSNCGLLWSYDWISIPLVYTQVVTIATYAFFVGCLVGRQDVEPVQYPFTSRVDLYVPFFTILQFLFYMGLLKVAEQLINPFGDDDEDFEMNWIIDRHVKVSYLIVDTLNVQCPPLVKDIYFDDPEIALPYTQASVQHKIPTYRGSVHSMIIPEDQHTMMLPEIREEVDELDDDEEPSMFRPAVSLSSVLVDSQIDGKDPRVGAISVPDEALLTGFRRSSLPDVTDSQSSIMTSPIRVLGSSGTWGRWRKLDDACVDAAAQTETHAIYRPQIETSVLPNLREDGGSVGVTDSGESQLRGSSAIYGDTSYRRSSLTPGQDNIPPSASPTRKRSVAWQPPRAVPSRWRRRKKAEVIWHPYVPPSASELSLEEYYGTAREELHELHGVSGLVPGSVPGSTGPVTDSALAVGEVIRGSLRRPPVPTLLVQAPSMETTSPPSSPRNSWTNPENECILGAQAAMEKSGLRQLLENRQPDQVLQLARQLHPGGDTLPEEGSQQMTDADSSRGARRKRMAKLPEASSLPDIQLQYSRIERKGSLPSCQQLRRVRVSTTEDLTDTDRHPGRRAAVGSVPCQTEELLRRTAPKSSRVTGPSRRRIGRQRKPKL